MQQSLLTSNFKTCVTTFLITPQRNDVSACMVNYFSLALAFGVIHRVFLGPFSSPKLQIHWLCVQMDAIIPTALNISTLKSNIVSLLAPLRRCHPKLSVD